MEYLDDCSTAIRHVARKVDLYVLEIILPQGCNFQTSGLAYDTKIVTLDWKVGVENDNKDQKLIKKFKA